MKSARLLWRCRHPGRIAENILGGLYRMTTISTTVTVSEGRILEKSANGAPHSDSNVLVFIPPPTLFIDLQNHDGSVLPHPLCAAATLIFGRKNRILGPIFRQLRSAFERRRLLPNTPRKSNRRMKIGRGCGTRPNGRSFVF